MTIVMPDYAPETLLNKKPDGSPQFVHLSIDGFDNKKLKKLKSTGFILKWGAKGMGFGELTFIKKGDELICETECMGKDFVKEALLALLEKAVLK